MVERRREPDLTPEVGEQRGCHEVGEGHLERDGDALDGVLSTVHLREAARRDAPLDAILAELLARAQGGASSGGSGALDGTRQLSALAVRGSRVRCCHRSCAPAARRLPQRRRTQ